MSRAVLHAGLLVLPLLVVALAAASPAPLSPPTFGSPVQLPASSGFAEPSIAVAPDGTAYVASPGSSTQTWRSTNGGASWQLTAATGQSGGDSDIAVGADGTVYASDLFNDAPVCASTSQATSFATCTASADTNSLDREWTAAAGTGVVYSTWRDGNDNERFAASTDGGRTFSTPITVVSGVSWRGNLLARTVSDLYDPYMDSSNGDVHIAISHDAGQSWATHDVATGDGGYACIFPAVAVDAAGTVYVAWCEIYPVNGPIVGNSDIFLAAGHDGGVTWDAPIKLSNDNFVNTFPWLVADAAGHVQVAWYEGQEVAGLPAVAGPNDAALVAWHVQVASSTSADQPSPTFTSVAATGTIHTGPICTEGTGCGLLPNPVIGDRSMLDFFEMAELPSGKSIITFPADSTPLGFGGGKNLFTITQAGGDLLK